MFKIWTILTFVVILRVEVNASCESGDIYQCVGNFYLKECSGNDDLVDANILAEGTGNVCYPGYSLGQINQIFQPSPNCSAEGQFSLFAATSRCDLYYTCATTGRNSEYNFVINSCGPQDFSPWAHKCMPKESAGCSITTPVPTSTTTIAPCITGVKRPDLLDCKKFYECTAPGVEKLVKCPFEFFFETTNSTCGSARTICDTPKRPYTIAAGDELDEEEPKVDGPGPLSFFFQY